MESEEKREPNHGRRRNRCPECGGSDLCQSTSGSELSAQNVEAAISASTGGSELSAQNVEAAISASTGGGELSTVPRMWRQQY